MSPSTDQLGLFHTPRKDITPSSNPIDTLSQERKNSSFLDRGVPSFDYDSAYLKKQDGSSHSNFSEKEQLLVQQVLSNKVKHTLIKKDLQAIKDEISAMKSQVDKTNKDNSDLHQ